MTLMISSFSCMYEYSNEQTEEQFIEVTIRVRDEASGKSVAAFLIVFFLWDINRHINIYAGHLVPTACIRLMCSFHKTLSWEQLRNYCRRPLFDIINVMASTWKPSSSHSALAKSLHTSKTTLPPGTRVLQTFQHCASLSVTCRKNLNIQGRSMNILLDFTKCSIYSFYLYKFYQKVCICICERGCKGCKGLHNPACFNPN